MTDAPPAPPTLKPPQRALWAAVVDDYDLAAAELRILEDALRLCERADAAGAVVDTEGVVTVDRYGSPKTHPAVDIETRCRTSAARLFAQIDVKVPPPAGSLRSGGKRGPRPRSQKASA